MRLVLHHDHRKCIALIVFGTFDTDEFQSTLVYFDDSVGIFESVSEVSIHIEQERVRYCDTLTLHLTLLNCLCHTSTDFAGCSICHIGEENISLQSVTKISACRACDGCLCHLSDAPRTKLRLLAYHGAASWHLCACVACQRSHSSSGLLFSFGSSSHRIDT